MYRTYRNPFTLEDQLAEKRAEYKAAVEAGADAEDLMDLSMDINELEQEVNFAWQDDEYDCDNCSGEFED